LHEILIRLQIRVALHHDHQTVEGAGEFIIGRDLVGNRSGSSDFRARVRHFHQHILLLLGVAFDRFHQIGNQVVAALQLIFHLRPGRLDGDVHLDEFVVVAREKGIQRNSQNRNDRRHNDDFLSCRHFFLLHRVELF